MNYVSHIALPFDKLEKLLNMPENARIVHVSDDHQGTNILLRVWSEVEPQSFSLSVDDPVSKIGEAYRTGEEKCVMSANGSVIKAGEELRHL